MKNLYYIDQINRLINYIDFINGLQATIPLEVGVSWMDWVRLVIVSNIFDKKLKVI